MSLFDVSRPSQGEWQRLAKEINQGSNTFAWNKLKELGLLKRGRKSLSSVAIHSDQILVLDNYFRAKGRPTIGDFLNSVPLATSLCESAEILFILPSASDETVPRLDVSRWDIKAMQNILRDTKKDRRPTHFEFEDVIRRDNPGRYFGRSGTAKVDGREKWYYELTATSPASRSIVCIGSPKASHASELALAEMFAVERFRTKLPKPSLPFYFLWNDARGETTHSTFQLASQEAGSKVRDSRISSECPTAALLVLNKSGTGYEMLSQVEAHPDSVGVTYAIVAAQRKAAGHVVVVVSGLNGPATLGASESLATVEMSANLRVGRNQPSPVYWGVVEVRFQSDYQLEHEYRVDHRHVESMKIHKPLVQWRSLSASACEMEPGCESSNEPPRNKRRVGVNKKQ